MAVCAWSVCCSKVEQAFRQDSTPYAQVPIRIVVLPHRNAFTSQYRLLPLLNQVAMPFYLTHQQVIIKWEFFDRIQSSQVCIIACPYASHLVIIITCCRGHIRIVIQHFQVLVAILSGALWVPYLSTFPSTLLLTTMVAFLISFLITKLGPVR